jgi:hypothetical protein
MKLLAATEIPRRFGPMSKIMRPQMAKDNTFWHFENKKKWTEEFPYDNFMDFISPEAKRYNIILERIKKLKLNAAVVPVEGNRHIFVFPGHIKLPRAAGGIFPFMRESPVMLVAHYDRIAGSPGANDNSAAVYQLLIAASILGERGFTNWIILFTDKEELESGESLSAQGSYSLSKKLISWGLDNARIYIFDACGTGDTIILSNTTDHILKNSDSPATVKAKHLTRQLRDYALETAHSIRLEQVLLAPTPFSDDAGFLRAGLSAQTITVLPSEEAVPYAALVLKHQEFAGWLITG